ncbi:hypothetical protein NA57DRAFT_56343 [Rhizodiscina lignyota]|uniref:Xylanolytic transcriptional activator regulatory domain-containing protein n=1 Tax=Rhizodiscina lignyota TaxID=1504668 RepID=A0A9P4M8T5_9PEZI|nr:hypothetical protein NA57DRAFT_56343 [Rhizodiscina lignyota]
MQQEIQQIVCPSTCITRSDKIRCSAERPSCAACRRKGRLCQYEGPTWPKESSPEPSPQASGFPDPYSSAPQIGDLAAFDGSNGLDFLPAVSAGFGEQPLWGYETIPFAGLLDLPDWTSSQDFSNTAALANGLSWYWPLDSPEVFTAQTDSTTQTPVISNDLQSYEHNISMPRPPDTVSSHGSGYESPVTAVWSGVETVPPSPKKAKKTHKTDSANKEDSFMRKICESLKGSPWEKIPLSQLPTKQGVERYVNLYFTRFHPYHPMLHRPSFNLGEEHVCLVITMAAFGAYLNGPESNRVHAENLFELGRRVLVYLGESDHKYKKQKFFVTTQLLQLIFARLSGNSRLFDIMESVRGALVINACDFGLVSPERNNDYGNGSIEEQWRTWIDQEKDCRLSWGVFETDSSATFLYNARPYIRLARMHVNMTCSEELWEAETAEEWAALKSSPGLQLQGPFFPDLLDELIGSWENGGLASRITNMRHQRVLMLATARMQWTLKDINTSTPIYYKSRGKSLFREEANDISKVMTSFQDAIRSSLKSAVLTSADYQHAARNLPIAHISHLYAAGDLMDWLYMFLQTEKSELQRGRMLRARWASERLDRVRQAAFHCGQLLGIARHYPKAFPQLPFMIFHAGAALWCIAPFLNGNPSKAPSMASISTRASTPANEATSVDRVRIDYLPEFGNLEALADPAKASELSRCRTDLDVWLAAGVNVAGVSRPMIVGIEGIRDVSTESGRLQVLRTAADLLAQQSACGISEKFRAVFELLTQNRENWK